MDKDESREGETEEILEIEFHICFYLLFCKHCPFIRKLKCIFRNKYKRCGIWQTVLHRWDNSRTSVVEPKNLVSF